jgi:ferritin-like metal-binding protein YciE
MERGSGTPSTRLRRARFLSSMPPANPAAAAPTAIAGPPALPATDFTVAAAPWPFCDCEERPPPELALLRLAVAPAEPLPARAALLRLRFDAALLRARLAPVDFARDAPPEVLPFERELPPAFFFAVVVFLCPLRAPDCPPREPDLLAAIFTLSCTGPVPFSLTPLAAPETGGPEMANRVRGTAPGNWMNDPLPKEIEMPDTPTRDAKLVQLLNEAYSKEKQLETALQAHIGMTTRDDYAKRLKDHLKETKSHATQVSKRIKQLGGSPETVSLPGPEGLTKAAESVSSAVGKAKAAAGGPLHAVRGSGEQDRMLRNARTEYEQEAHEIATYTVIDSLATAVGDKQTAKLARDILREEERMQKFLIALIPDLSVDVAHDEIPVSEIEGPASRRTARESTAKPSGGRAKAKA